MLSSGAEAIELAHGAIFDDGMAAMDADAHAHSFRKRAAGYPSRCADSEASSSFSLKISAAPSTIMKAARWRPTW